MVSAARVLTLDTAVAAADGTALATDVTVADDGQQHPVVLVRTPYGRASARAAHDAVGLARLGFAVVTQDVRGRWDSAGGFTPFRSEREDGARTVAWCATQPWSAGAVAMIGASYNGFTQWLALADRPAGLRVVAPAVAGPSIRSVAYEGGALQLGVFSSWTLGLGAIGNNLGDAVRQASIEALDTWPASIPQAENTLTAISPEWQRWLGSRGSLGRPGSGDPDGDGPWAELDAAPALDGAGAEVAGYHLAGWHDLFCENTIAGYSLLAGGDGRAAHRQRLVVGPWSHLSMLRRSTGQLDFGVAAMGDFNGLYEEQVGFLSAGLAGGEVPHGVRVYVMGTNRWIDLEAWPPPAHETAFYLAADGRLDRPVPRESGADRYHHDPAHPVPTNGGRTLHPVLPEAGPRDQHDVERRPDVLVYTGDVLSQDLTVLGTVRAHVVFESTAPVADVTVKLVDVHPDGTAMSVVDSVRRVELPAGGSTEVEVTVGSTAMTFRAGHRIRVEIASSNYPRFDLCPAGDQTVHRGGRAASRIVLPTYAGTLP